MDFELTDEQRDIQRAARDFAERTFPEVAEECDLNDFHDLEKACTWGL
jgi:hypothetical protein